MFSCSCPHRGPPPAPNTTVAGRPAPHRTLTFATGSQPSCQGNQAGALGSREDEELSSKGNEQGFITGPGPGGREILTSPPPSAQLGISEESGGKRP